MIDQASSPTFFLAEALSHITKSGLDLLENDIRTRFWSCLRNMFSSLDDYTQDTIDLILSHMNSIARKSLNGKTPYEMFTYIFGTQLTDLLNIQKIEPENVIQSPILIN